MFSAQAKKRINRNQARLLTSPKIQALGGDHLQLRYAEARHDGMAPVIPQVALASERTDDHQRSSRPQRGGVRKPRPKSPSPTSAASTPPLEEWTIDDGDWGVSQ